MINVRYIHSSPNHIFMLSQTGSVVHPPLTIIVANPLLEINIAKLKLFSKLI